MRTDMIINLDKIIREIWEELRKLRKLINNITSSSGVVDHLTGSSTSPSISAGPGLGDDPTINIVTTQSSDLAGRFSFTTGTSATDGLMCTITFASAFTRIPIVNIFYEESNAALLSTTGVYVNVSTTSFEFFSQSTPPDLTTHTFSYIVIEGK